MTDSSKTVQLRRYELVEGVLDDGLDALHAYVASLNMGTLVGAPKVRAAQLLRACEPRRRGPYGGAVGFLSASGEMDTAIVIRSALVRDGVAEVRAGAGVVLDSDPHAEARETRRKAEAVLRAILRAGAYELMFRKDVPARVVITEYVDVTHGFYGEDEPGLVNAVLDSLAREVRPGELEKKAAVRK